MGSLDLEFVLASCSYYPVAMDPCRRLIWFARVDRETYRRAGFLIPKHAPMGEERYGFNVDDVLLHDLSLPVGGALSHYIFISAFCCSTLLARLLDEVPNCLVLKEPCLLGQVAMLRYRPYMAHNNELLRADDSAQNSDSTIIRAPAGTRSCFSVCSGATDEESWQEDWQTWAGLSVRLLARTFESGQTVIVKVADVCNTMGDVILANDPRSKAVLVSVDLRTFILSVLKQESRRVWTRKRATFWHKTLTRFRAFYGVTVPELGDAEQAAYIWLVTAALWDRFRKDAKPERVLLMDGEQVSENPGGVLRKVADFFDLRLEEGRIKKILADAVLTQHAKSPGQSYDASRRRNDLAAWEARYGLEADRAIEWAASIRTTMEADGIDLGAMAGDEIEKVTV